MPSVGASSAVSATPRTCASAWAWVQCASVRPSGAIGYGCSTPSPWSCSPCSAPPARRSATTAISNPTPPSDAPTRCSAKAACSMNSFRPCPMSACAPSCKASPPCSSNSRCSHISSVQSENEGIHEQQSPTPVELRRGILVEHLPNGISEHHDRNLADAGSEPVARHRGPETRQLTDHPCAYPRRQQTDSGELADDQT